MILRNLEFFRLVFPSGLRLIIPQNALSGLCEPGMRKRIEFPDEPKWRWASVWLGLHFTESRFRSASTDPSMKENRTPRDSGGLFN